MYVYAVFIKSLHDISKDVNPLYIISNFNHTPEVLKDLRKNKFTSEWWEDHTITDCHYKGELWFMKGVKN